MIRWLFIAALFCTPAVADPAWDKFFDDPKADVARSTGANGEPLETVVLPGQIQLQRRKSDTGPTTYLGVDFSDHGAVGCIARILGELAFVEHHCPSTLSPEQSLNLREKLQRLAAFYEQNAVPETTVEAYLANIDTAIAEREPLTCTAISPDFLAFRDQLFGPEFDATFNDMLSVARLPVPNPCL